MKKRMVSVLLIISMMLTLFLGVTPVNAATDAIKVTIEAQNVQHDNAYFEGNIPSFSLTLENRYSSPRDTVLTYSISNDEGVSVESETRMITLEGKQKIIVGFMPDIEGKFGVYTITATLSTSSDTATDTFKFSYTKNIETMLDSLGYACHFSKTGNPGGNYAYIGYSQELLKGSGAGWVRDEINWSNIETVKGKYEVPARYENMVNGAIANGKKVLLLVSGGNTLYESGIGPNGEPTKCLPVTEEGIQGFANFAAFVAEHFKGRVDAFEIWNEPDLTTFNGHYDWLPSNTSYGWTTLAKKSAAAYAKLIKAVYPAIKSVYAGEEDKVTVISGGCLPVKSDVGYLSRMLSVDGVQDYMDAVGVHPYAVDATPADLCSGSSQDFSEQMRRVKSFTKKPIWITEYGASSFGNSENDGYDGESSFKGYGIHGIRGQAFSLVRAFMVVACDPQIEKIFIYNFKEKSETPSIEANFGVIGYDYVPKGAYAAISNMADFLGNAEAVTKIEANETNYAFGDCARIYEFADKQNGDEIFVVAAGGSQFEWGTKLKISEAVDPLTGNANAVLDNNSKSVSINTYAGGFVKVFDIMGNEIQPSGGVYPIYLTPMYVVCSKNNETKIVNSDRIEIEGYNAKPDGFVSAVVYKTNVIGKKIANIEQVKADRYGRYSFSFEKNKSDIYEIRFYDGAVYNNNNIGTENYDLNLKYFVNGVEIQDVSAIKAGDKVRLEMEITDKNGIGTNLISYGCVYSNESVMLSSDRNVTAWNNNRAVLTAEVVVPANGNADSLKFMIWNVNMQPVINMIQTK